MKMLEKFILIALIATNATAGTLKCVKTGTFKNQTLGQQEESGKTVNKFFAIECKSQGGDKIQIVQDGKTVSTQDVEAYITSRN